MKSNPPQRSVKVCKCGHVVKRGAGGYCDVGWGDTGKGFKRRGCMCKQHFWKLRPSHRRGVAEPKHFKVKWGFCTLEVFPTHKEVVIERKPLGSDSTTPERFFMSTKGFTHFARQFLKKYKQPTT